MEAAVTYFLLSYGRKPEPVLIWDESLMQHWKAEGRHARMWRQGRVGDKTQ